MDLIYHLGLHLFKILLVVASPFNKKAKMWLHGRKGWYDHVKRKLTENETRIWIHAASLGEYEQGRPVIEALKRKKPKQKIVLTFFSPSGYEIQKNYEFADYVFYLPLDTKRNAKRFIHLIRPDFVIFIKYEFWHNFLNTLKRQNIPTYLVSAIFRKDQVFFHWYGKWYRKMLYQFDHFFVQNSESKQLLEMIDIKEATVSGDTRFDRVYDIASTVKSFPVVEKFCNNKFTFILGSSWKADEEILFDFINDSNNQVKFIIAPHEIHNTNIERIISNLKKKYQRYSLATQINVNEADILIIDNIGILSSIYQYGNIAYIGGGFGSGIHNILEAATFGLPVLFGPNYKKFKEAIELIELGGAFVVKDSVSVTNQLQKLIKDKEHLELTSNKCKDYIKAQKGATITITEYLHNN